jgi:spermidine synthase
MAGVANLFTREFLTLCKARLNPDGLVCVWFHTYRMSLRDVKMIVRTFDGVFPNSSLWFAMPSDIFLMGWKNPDEKPSLSLATQRALHNAEAMRDLSSIGIDYPTAITTCFLMGSKEMRRFSSGAPIHTDDHPILEFSAPKYMFADTVESNFKELRQARSEQPYIFPDLGPVLAGSAGFHYYNALALEYKELYKQATKEAEKAYQLSPDSELARTLVARLKNSSSDNSGGAR